MPYVDDITVIQDWHFDKNELSGMSEGGFVAEGES